MTKEGQNRMFDPILWRHARWSAVVILCMSVWSCGWFEEMQAQRQKVYADLTQLCESIPVPEGLEKGKSNELIKPDRGSVTNNFETELSCEAVTRPMYQYLRERGWQPTKNHLGYYYRDNYLFNVTCIPLLNAPNRKRVQRSCGWDLEGADKDFF
jgi:hypothetical protein